MKRHTLQNHVIPLCVWSLCVIILWWEKTYSVDKKCHYRNLIGMYGIFSESNVDNIVLKMWGILIQSICIELEINGNIAALAWNIKHLSEWMCGHLTVWTYERTNVLTYERTDVWTYERTDVLTYWYIDVWTYWSERIRNHLSLAVRKIRNLWESQNIRKFASAYRCGVRYGRSGGCNRHIKSVYRSCSWPTEIWQFQIQVKDTATIGAFRVW